MCGISVLISHREELAAISRMTSSMNHRGPDMQDTYVDPVLNIALGHNRLSILDLSINSIQPMISQNGRYILTYNGEVYNYLELKKELQQKNYIFKTTSDTEVILYGYQEWGAELFLKLNGMWACAILDRLEQKLILSRDRFGIKPLYYYQHSKNFIVASEIKGILSSGLVSADVSLTGLNEYFTFQNVISDHTLFKNIYMLPPGYNMHYDLKSNRCIKQQYWDISYNNEQAIDEKNFCEELYNTLQSSINKMLVSDVPIGATISGGMDSSAIVSLASKNIQQFKTFNGYFEHENLSEHEKSFNEHHDARLISNIFGTKHFEKMITSQDVFGTLPQVVWHLEDPKVGMCYTFYLINELVKKQVTVNLSGTGGDEILGGYPWRYSLISNCNNNKNFSDIYYDYWSRLIKDKNKQQFFSESVYKNLDHNQTRTTFDNIIDVQQNNTPLNKAMYFEIKTFLHGMLMVEDKMGMAHSVETRFPFLENDMVRLASRIPSRYKFKNNEAKLLLKKAFGKVLPENIINKKKQGFTPPDQTWYKTILNNDINKLLMSKTSNIKEYVNQSYIDEILAQHNKGVDQRLLIWSLIFFEQWLKIFIINTNHGSSATFTGITNVTLS